MVVAAARKLEKAVRRFRDENIIRPLARSHRFRKQSESQFDAVILDAGDHWIAYDPTDYAIGSTISRTGGWMRGETMWIFAQMPRSNGVFIDVGANIGTQTLYALKFGGFERAVCFEPVPKNARLLRLNMHLNGLSEKVTVIEAAAGSSKGFASLSLNAFNRGAHSLVRDNQGERIQVDVVVVEEELAKLGIRSEEIGLAWIDVEGFEAEVIKGWPSLEGVPLALECSPSMPDFPFEFLSSYQKWALVDERTPWRSIDTLNPSSFSQQVDLIFA